MSPAKALKLENWAVIAPGGRKNMAEVGDKGIDGRSFPVSVLCSEFRL